MSDTVIKIDNLVKKFGTLTAVDDVSFEVRRGELFAFLGVNGAGKSTTISVICGQLDRDGGTVVIDGRDIDVELDGIKRDIGVVFQNSALDKVLNVKDNLKSRAALYGIFGAEFEKRYAELDGMLSLKELEKRAVGKLSGGQRRRCDIARALLHKPELLILDEPTTGLDPKTRITVWKIIEKLRKESGLTVFLTTHYMEEAADSDYVVIIDAGKIAAEGTPHALKNAYASDFIKFYNRREEAEKYFGKLGYKFKTERDYTEVELKSTSETPAFFKEMPELFDDFEILKGNMDNVFLKVTGKDLTGV